MKCIGIQKQQWILVLKQCGDMYSRLDLYSSEETKKVINVEMMPISKYSITIALAFYATQADKWSPFKGNCVHHKRATIKIG